MSAAVTRLGDDNGARDADPRAEKAEASLPNAPPAKVSDSARPMIVGAAVLAASTKGRKVMKLIRVALSAMPIASRVRNPCAVHRDGPASSGFAAAGAGARRPARKAAP